MLCLLRPSVEVVKGGRFLKKIKTPELVTGIYKSWLHGKKRFPDITPFLLYLENVIIKSNEYRSGHLSSYCMHEQ